MLGALWGGAYVLNFFGVSLAALRIAGGFVVASSAWVLLQRPEQNEERKAEQASHATGEDDVAFYPLTMPFTTGPGTIAVAIAIGSNLPVGKPGFLAFFLGASAAAVAIAAMVLVAYSFADRIVALLGPQQARVVTRLAAFLLLCVGVQITLNGIAEFVGRLCQPAGRSPERRKSGRRSARHLASQISQAVRSAEAFAGRRDRAAGSRNRRRNIRGRRGNRPGGST